MNILLIKLDHIGDVLLMTPALRALKEQRPQDNIDVCVSKKSAVVLANNPFIRKLYFYEASDFDRDGSINDEVRLSNLLTLDEIREKKYDVCIGFREDHHNIPIQLMCAAKKNISFCSNTQFAQYLDQTIENDPSKHSAEIFFDLLGLLGIRKPEEIKPEIYPSEPDRQWASSLCIEYDRKPKIAFSVGGGWFLNWWPIESYIELKKRILTRYPDAVIFLVGGASEKVLESKFLLDGSDNVVSVIGKTNIGQLASLYEQMDLVVTNDGGPMHIATTTESPVIALFGPSPYRRFGPLGKNNTVISLDMPCSPCPQFVKGKKPRCTDNKCMKEISVEVVFREIKKKLSEKGIK